MLSREGLSQECNLEALLIWARTLAIWETPWISLGNLGRTWCFFFENCLTLHSEFEKFTFLLKIVMSEKYHVENWF